MQTESTKTFVVLGDYLLDRFSFQNNFMVDQFSLRTLYTLSRINNLLIGNLIANCMIIEEDQLVNIKLLKSFVCY